MLLLLDIDPYYSQTHDELLQQNIEEDFLDRPILEIALDLHRLNTELSRMEQTKRDEVKWRYLLIKSALEVDRCLKVTAQSKVQIQKVAVCSQIFAEVSGAFSFTLMLGAVPLAPLHPVFPRRHPQ